LRVVGMKIEAVDYFFLKFSYFTLPKKTRRESWRDFNRYNN
jgi:hypothetical protein